MRTHRCPAHCGGCGGLTRRQFVGSAAAAVTVGAWVGPWLAGGGAEAAERVRPCGPASRCEPKLRACFVRRRGEYGMRWPGQIYDGEAARESYARQIAAAAEKLGMKVDLRPEPIYSLAEADAWCRESVDAKPDGLLVVLLDRQEHAWPTAERAIDTNLPTVVFSPLGTSFTTNTAGPSRKPGCFIASTDRFEQAAYGMKMLAAGAKIRATRALIIAGNEAREDVLPQLGIQLKYLPARQFLEEYEKTPEDDDVRSLAGELIAGAKRLVRATEQDVLNGIRSYVVARRLLEREQCDAISMDCLGALGRTKVSLPCIAWSKMNDDGVPAACEADLGAVATHVLVQALFDRPGFQQDPVAETAREAIIGAHCSCPTRLDGFDAESAEYDIVPHHGARDATARPVWRLGQRVTCADVLPGSDAAPTQVLISEGEVIENCSAPPSGGCVVSVMVRFDRVEDVLAFPGFHQVFFYGGFRRELVQFCRLFRLQPVVV